MIGFPLTPPSPHRDCVAIGRGRGETRQPDGFETFRMRTFRGICHDGWYKKVNFLIDLESLNLMIWRLRPKAFSPVCLSRFLEFLPPFPVMTQSHRGEGGVRGPCNGRFARWPFVRTRIARTK
jgi:hypothetical protein